VDVFGFPILGEFHEESGDKAEERGLVGEDAGDAGAAFGGCGRPVGPTDPNLYPIGYSLNSTPARASAERKPGFLSIFG